MKGSKYGGLQTFSDLLRLWRLLRFQLRLCAAAISTIPPETDDGGTAAWMV